MPARQRPSAPVRQPAVKAPPDVLSLSDRPGYPLAVTVALTSIWARVSDGYFVTPRACIASTRAAIDVYKAFELSATPWPCGVWVGNDQARALINAAIPVDQWDTVDPTAHSVGIHPDTPACGSGWNGHIVAQLGDWIVDLSARQFHRPKYGMRVRPLFLPVPDSPDNIYQVDGTWFRYQHRPELAAWRQSKDWRNPTPAALLADAVNATATMVRRSVCEDEP